MTITTKESLDAPFAVRRSLSLNDIEARPSASDKRQTSSMGNRHQKRNPFNGPVVDKFNPLLIQAPKQQPNSKENEFVGKLTPGTKSCLRGRIPSNPETIIIPNSSNISVSDESSFGVSPKRSISFSTRIESICLFKTTDSPVHISSSARYSVPDNGDLEVKSISSVMDQPWTWSRMNFCRNSYPHFSFDGPPVILEEVHLTLKRVAIEREASLTSLAKSPAGYFLIGSVLVQNWALQKYVGLRYSVDNWTTWKELAVPYYNVFRHGIDRFRFELDLNEEFKKELATAEGTTVNGKLSFAIKYCVNGQEFWDNYGSKNYHVYLVFPPLYLNINLQMCDIQRFISKRKRKILSGSKSRMA